MTEPPSTPQSEDPLQRFLFATAFVLLVIMGVDEFQMQSLAESTERAQALSERVLSPLGCSGQAAGLKGEGLVIACRNMGGDEVMAAVRGVLPQEPGFERFYFQNAEGFLVCDHTTSAWSQATCPSIIRPALPTTADGSQRPPSQPRLKPEA